MTTIPTLTEVSVEDYPCGKRSGTVRKRARVIVRGTTGGTGDTLDLATYIPGVQGIEGVELHTVAGAVRATYPTWSGTTITFAGHTSTGVTVAVFVVYF